MNLLKKVLSVLLCVIMVISIIPLSDTNVDAASITEDNVKSKLDSISSEYKGKSFSVNKSKCNHNGFTEGCYENCYLGAILEAKGISKSSYNYDGFTCWAFASYCFTQCFGKKWYENTTNNNYTIIPFSGTKNATTVKEWLTKYASVGDIICWTGHYAVIRGVSSSGVKIMDANVDATTSKTGIVRDGEVSFSYIAAESNLKLHHANNYNTKNIYFKSLSHSDVTKTNAKITANIYGTYIGKAGCYIGTSTDSMKKYSETINSWSDKIWYEMDDNVLNTTLKPGTTYYYKLFVTVNGTEYCSEIKSFTTVSNTLSVYYNANGGSIDSSTYHLSSNIVYKSSDNSKLCHKWTYNNPQKDGLYNASTFGLYKNGYEFVGWSTTPEGELWFDQDDTGILPIHLNSAIKNGDCSVTMYAVWAKSNDFFESVFANSFSTNGAYLGADIASEEYGSLKLNIGISEDSVTHIIDCPPPFAENQIYFNIAEHGLVLEPSTTYCYSFTAAIDGNTYESEKGYFTTLDANGYFTNIYATDVEEDNAVIVADFVRTNIEEYGIYLTPYGEETYRYSCDYVADTEELSLSIKEYADFTLDPNRTYLYRFFIVENGTEWISEEHEFCTAPPSYYFIDVKTETTTPYNAVIYADIYDVAVDSAGFYIGKSENDLTKVVTIQERENTSVVCYEFCYSITDYYKHLDPDTEYCYKFYFVINGTEYSSRVYSFRTQEEGISQPGNDDTISIKINALSDTVMNCGETVMLSAVTTGNLPEETSIIWEVSNDNFELSIHPWFDVSAMLEAKTVGSTTVTAKIVDESGDVIAQDELIVFAEYNSEKPDEKYLEIRNPSITSINYGDSIKLHADLNGELPDGWYVEWTSDNENFNIDVSEKGSVCKLSPASSGDTVITATVYDEEGNEVCSDTQVMTSKAGFFHKIIGFFKGLFGLTKDYEW